MVLLLDPEVGHQPIGPEEGFVAIVPVAAGSTRPAVSNAPRTHFSPRADEDC